MDTPKHQARRATLDDLPLLKELWQTVQLPVDTLEKRFTEFQIIQDAEGRIIGALGLQIENHHGHVHSETIPDMGQVDSLRPELWSRLLAVARNHGLFRLWTQDGAGFWREQGFEAPAQELLAKMPGGFGSPERPWLTLKLKDDVVGSISLEHEFKMFKEAVQQESEEAYRQARMLKVLATVLAIGFLIFVITGGVYYMKYVKYKNEGGTGSEMPAAQPEPGPRNLGPSPGATNQPGNVPPPPPQVPPPPPN